MESTAKKASAHRTRLSRTDWIDAALDALAELGPEGVNIERISVRLGITTGSFYWHFRDRDDLVQAMLDRWYDLETGAMIERVRNEPDLELREVMLAVTAGNPFRRHELAFRAMAITDERVAHYLQRLNEIRREAVERLFEERGYERGSEEHRRRTFILMMFAQFFVIFYGDAPTKFIEEVVDLIVDTLE